MKRFYIHLAAITALVATLAVLAVVATLILPPITLNLPALSVTCTKPRKTTLLASPAAPSTLKLRLVGVEASIRAEEGGGVEVSVADMGGCIEKEARLSGGVLDVEVKGRGCCSVTIKLPKTRYRSIEVHGMALQLTIDGVNAENALIDAEEANIEAHSLKLGGLALRLETSNAHIDAEITKSANITASLTRLLLHVTSPDAEVLVKPTITTEFQTTCRGLEGPRILVSAMTSSIHVICRG